MNEQHLEQWITELRTTDLAQAKEFLCGPTPEGDVGYCCLGIGLRLSDPGNDALGSGEEGLVPSGFIDWLGLEYPDGSDPDDGDHYDVVLDVPNVYDQRDRKDHDDSTVTAAVLNDGWNLTFDQIADMLAYFGLRSEARS